MQSGYMRLAISAILAVALTAGQHIVPESLIVDYAGYLAMTLGGLGAYMVVEGILMLRRTAAQRPGDSKGSAIRILMGAFLILLIAAAGVLPLQPEIGSAAESYRWVALAAVSAYVFCEALMARRRIAEAPGADTKQSTRHAPRPVTSRTGKPINRILVLSVLMLFLIVSYSETMTPDFLPAGLEAYRDVVLAAVALLILIDALVAVRKQRGENVGSADTTHALKAPRPPSIQEGAGYGEVLAFLSLLQEKGRFIDFVMEDVTPFNDTQVAAASRVVHQGCAAVIREYFEMSPVHGGKEGENMTIDKGADPHQYRLVGKVTGAPPFYGVVLHRGWKTAKLSLPRYATPVDPSAPNIITPVEVEVR
ncbi:MAG: DUF2760 domain-containing protein [Gammaproteobacteria bacterium]